MRKMLTNGRFVLVLVVLTAAGLLVTRELAGQNRNGVQAPYFEVDPLWPKPLPNHWVLGSTIGVSVDERDHVWIIHRGSATLGNNEKGARAEAADGECCAGAPPVLEFDPGGNLVRHWGGPVRATSGRRRITASPSITRATSGSAATAPATRRSSSSRRTASSCCRSASPARAGPNKGQPTYAAAATIARSFGASRRSSSTRATNEAYLADGY